MRQDVPLPRGPDDYGSAASAVIEAHGRPPSLLIWYGEVPPPPPPYLVSDTLPETGVAIIGGQFGVGKTFVGAALVASVMTGRAFADADVIRSGAVLWLAAEGENEIEGRVRAATEHLIGSAGRQPFARQAGGVPLLTEADALVRLKALVREAENYARDKFSLPLSLIVVDTLSAAAGFNDENNASETQKVMNLLRELSREARALVLLIDHYGKIVDTGIRGSSAKSGAADAILACLGERDGEGKVANRRMAVVKVRSGPTGRVIPFELRVVDIDGGTSCIVEWSTQKGCEKLADKTRPWPKSLVIFKRALEKTLADQGTKIRPFPDGPEVLAVDREAIRAEFTRTYPAENVKAKSEAFRRCEKDAVARNLVTSRSVGTELMTTMFWFVREET